MNNKQIIEAMKIVKQHCENTEHCRQCPIFSTCDPNPCDWTPIKASYKRQNGQIIN